jgi:hypothetical protein
MRLYRLEIHPSRWAPRWVLFKNKGGGLFSHACWQIGPLVFWWLRKSMLRAAGGERT